jgi:endogenous inhibitor of DNA gyrase (YacG/DUF329 family)
MTKKHGAYKCPNCTQEFVQTADGSTCPYCHTKLKSVRRKRGNVFEYYYVIDETKQMPETTVLVMDEGKLVSLPNEDPEIWEIVENKHYRVVYKRPEIMSSAMWVYCPFCQSKLFQNQFLSGHTVQEHKCKCGILLQFLFQMPIGPFRMIT